jgi:hypothetical protein
MLQPLQPALNVTEANMDISRPRKFELLGLAAGSTFVWIGLFLVIWRALFS